MREYISRLLAKHETKILAKKEEEEPNMTEQTT